MTRMTGGAAVVKTLIANGVDTVFGIPGLHNLPIYDALYDAADSVRHILARHEGGAGLMANGYARTSGRPGVVLVTTGPAACNAMIALADAYRDSVPLLVLASQIAGPLIGSDRGAFHEMRDQLGMAAGAAGWSRRVTGVSEIPAAINDAWHAMTGGRPRPAYIEIPEDTLCAAGEVTIAAACVPPPGKADPAAAEGAAQLLARAKRPLFYAGGGVMWSGASAALVALAEKLAAPVAVTCNGKGSLPDDHPLALGYAAFRGAQFRELWLRADVVLAVGTDFDEIATCAWQRPAPAQLIQIDVDAEQIGRNCPVTVGLTGDAAAVLRQLADMVATAESAEREAWARDATAEARSVRCRASGCDGWLLVQALSDALGRDGIAVGDAAQAGIWQLELEPTYTPRSFLLPLGFGTLGFGVPAALGAQAAWPDRRVICLCGDGGFLFTSQELATAVQHRLNAVIVVVNDNAFGAVRNTQQQRYGGRVIASDLVNPDLARYAEAFNAFGARIETLAELPSALDAAFASSKPGVIEVPGPIAPPPV